MNALQYNGKRFSVKDLPLPAAPDGEALVRVLAAGICATDLEIGRGYMNFIGIPGHEFVGVVDECARSDLKGKRVVGEINCPCGTCEICRRGLGRHCPQRTVLGISGRNGCFAEYLTLPEGNLHALPHSLSDFQGVMVEPLAAAYRIVEQTGNVAGRRAAVVGDGRLGLLAAQVLASEGAHVSLFGHHPERRDLVSGWGVDFKTSEAGETSSFQKSFPLVVDCTGSLKGADLAMGLVEPLGTLIVKSTINEALRFPSGRIVVDEITILGSRCGPFPRAIRALESGRVVTDGMLDASYSLEDAVEAIDHASRPGALKVLLTMV